MAVRSRGRGECERSLYSFTRMPLEDIRGRGGLVPGLHPLWICPWDPDNVILCLVSLSYVIYTVQPLISLCMYL